VQALREDAADQDVSLRVEDGEGRSFDITGLQYGLSFNDGGYSLTLVVRER
jgi:hypothetical protein